MTTASPSSIPPALTTSTTPATDITEGADTGVFTRPAYWQMGDELSSTQKYLVDVFAREGVPVRWSFIANCADNPPPPSIAYSYDVAAVTADNDNVIALFPETNSYEEDGEIEREEILDVDLEPVPARPRLRLIRGGLSD